MDKYLRTQMALENGADLVLELPVCYCCASASRFAWGAVSLLDRLGVVDCLVFGSECGDISLLEEAASVLAAEPPGYTELLRANLRLGHSYPSAQSAALTDYIRAVPSGYGGMHTAPAEGLPLLLASPNNILGIEYCKSLRSLCSSIRPVTIPRKGSGYLDTALPEDNGVGKPSAMAIRALLREGSAMDSLYPYVPEPVYALLRREYGKAFPIFPDALSQMLHYKLLSEAEYGFSDYLDVSPDLSDRIRNLLPGYRSFSSFCMDLKTKELTYTRISRSLLHILLQIRKADVEYADRHGIPYARILGFRTAAAPLLTAVKAGASVPLISKLANAEKSLEKEAGNLLQKDIHAARLYNALILHTCKTRLPDETRRQIVRI